MNKDDFIIENFDKGKIVNVTVSDVYHTLNVVFQTNEPHRRYILKLDYKTPKGFIVNHGWVDNLINTESKLNYVQEMALLNRIEHLDDIGDDVKLAIKNLT